MQIYMENIIDLLDDSNPRSKRDRECLQIREDPKTGIYVDGLIQVSVSSLEEVIALIKEGVKNRMTYSTTMVLNIILLGLNKDVRTKLQAEVMRCCRCFLSRDGSRSKRKAKANLQKK